MYSSLRQCIQDLESKQQAIRIESAVDPNLEMAEIHRLVYSKGGPALWFKNVKGSPFEAASNIYGTEERCNLIFGDIIKKMELLVALKADPMEILRSPLKHIKTLPFALKAIPRKVRSSPDMIKNKTTISKLPAIKSWPDDGGAFVTLPQVISFPPGDMDAKKGNIGMYRIQLNGNAFTPDREIGLHYQLHRGIGIHHKQHLSENQEFPITVAVGGPPSYALASIFPLPEDLSEILFTGLLGNRNYRYYIHEGFFIPTEVDFCITGHVNLHTLKPEGPFGDHLGYYSLKHPFPFLQVQNVFHKKNPIWHFTIVGRPPQEDSSFGYLIHQMVKEITKDEFKGVKEIHAVDVAGVHPLLLAIGSERYMPFRETRPEEIITQAMHILGKGQTSLAKYLLICNTEEDSGLSVKDVRKFLSFILERIRLDRDLHFITNTTIDTLDYSGDGWNAGSKLIMAVNGAPLRNLSDDISSIQKQDHGLKNLKIVIPGIVVAEYSELQKQDEMHDDLQVLEKQLQPDDWKSFPLLVICDDASFCAQSLDQFLWVCFTRSNPATDIYGAQSKTEYKHWSCHTPLIIDARKKSHHAPELISDPDVQQRVRNFMIKTPELKSFAE